MIDSAFGILFQRSETGAAGFFIRPMRSLKILRRGQPSRVNYSNTKDLFTSLQSKEFSCGIITRNCTKAVQIVFPDILSYCPVVICRNDVKNVKPHPEHITLALAKLGASAPNTLMIGDHPIDIHTGRNAGTKACGVLTGRCRKTDFIDAGADIILSRAADLLNIVK